MNGVEKTEEHHLQIGAQKAGYPGNLHQRTGGGYTFGKAAWRLYRSHRWILLSQPLPGCCQGDERKRRQWLLQRRQSSIWLYQGESPGWWYSQDKAWALVQDSTYRTVHLPGMFPGHMCFIKWFRIIHRTLFTIKSWQPSWFLLLSQRRNRIRYPHIKPKY